MPMRFEVHESVEGLVTEIHHFSVVGSRLRRRTVWRRCCCCSPFVWLERCMSNAFEFPAILQLMLLSQLKVPHGTHPLSAVSTVGVHARAIVRDKTGSFTVHGAEQQSEPCRQRNPL